MESIQGTREGTQGQEQAARLEEAGALDAARIALLYRSATMAYVASPVYAGLLILVLWDQATSGVLIAWFAGMVAVSTLRAAMHGAYLRSADRLSLLWERRFGFGTLAAGAAWSAAPLIFFADASAVGRLAIFFVIGGALIGAAGMYAASRAAFYAFVSLPLAAATWVLADLPGEGYRVIAVMLALFAVLLSITYTQLRSSVISSLRIGHRNVVLSGRLSESEARLRDAIESSPDGIAIFDEADRLATCNAVYAALYAPGRRPNDLVGTNFRSIAESAFDQAELVADTERGDREAWIDRRIARHRAGTGELCRFQTRDGRWLQGKNVRTPLGGIVGVFMDISETMRADAALQAVLAEENMVFDVLPVGIMFVQQRRIVRCNRRLEQMLGYEPGSLVGKETRILFGSAQSWNAVGADTYSRLRQGGIVEDDTRLARKDGSHLWCRSLGRAIDSSDPEAGAIFAISDAHDATQAKQAAAAIYENVERLRLAVDAADLYYWEWQISDDKFTWGREPAGLLGPPRSGDPLQDSDFRTLVHPDDRARFEDTGRRAIDNGEPYFCEFRVIGHEGRMRWLAARGKVVYGERGIPQRVIGVSQDVTERKHQEEEVRFLAHHDALTGLPNRRLLDDRLRQAVFAAERRGTRVAVMVIDLDQFKAVNDSLGHKAGDAVLREVANRLAVCVRKADTLARQGGDEFVVVIPELALDTDCTVIAEKILRAMQPEIWVDEQSFNIGASIGLSLFPEDARDGDALLRNADVAMYRAKELGRNNYQFFGK